MAEVGSEFRFGYGTAVDEEFAIHYGSAEFGVGRNIDDGAGVGGFEHGQQFSGNVPAEG